MLVSLYKKEDIPLEFKQFIKKYLINKYEMLNDFKDKMNNYTDLIKNKSKDEIDNYHRINNIKNIKLSINFSRSKNFLLNKYYDIFINKYMKK